VEACLVAYEITKNLGHPQLAVEAARRRLDAARPLGDPALFGFAQWYYSLILMRLGVRRRASTTLVTAVNELSDLADTTADETLAAQILACCTSPKLLRLHARTAPTPPVPHLTEASSIVVKAANRTV
jgi:hypothetical protein